MCKVWVCSRGKWWGSSSGGVIVHHVVLYIGSGNGRV
jgi:hypothetical protein